MGFLDDRKVNRGLTDQQGVNILSFGGQGAAGTTSTKAADEVSDKVSPFTLSPPRRRVFEPYRGRTGVVPGVVCDLGRRVAKDRNVGCPERHFGWTFSIFDF